MINKLALLLCLTVAAAMAGYYFGYAVEAAKLIDLFDILIQVGAIVVAVTGAWLGLIYPDVVKRVLDRNTSESVAAAEAAKTNRVIVPLLLGTMALCVALATRVVLTFLPASAQSEEISAVFSSIATVSACALLIALVWILLPAGLVSEKLGAAVEQKADVSNFRRSAHPYSDV